jgi:hypothetical protein
MNQRSSRILTLASFADIQPGRGEIAKFFVGPQYKSRATPSAFLRGAISGSPCALPLPPPPLSLSRSLSLSLSLSLHHTEQGAFYSNARATRSERIYRRGGSGISRTARKEASLGTKDLLFSTYELAGASRIARARFSRTVGYVIVCKHRPCDPDRCERSFILPPSLPFTRSFLPLSLLRSSARRAARSVSRLHCIPLHRDFNQFNTLNRFHARYYRA